MAGSTKYASALVVSSSGSAKLPKSSGGETDPTFSAMSITSSRFERMVGSASSKKSHSWIRVLHSDSRVPAFPILTQTEPAIEKGTSCAASCRCFFIASGISKSTKKPSAPDSTPRICQQSHHQTCGRLCDMSALTLFSKALHRSSMLSSFMPFSMSSSRSAMD